MSRIVQGFTATNAIITIDTQEQMYSWVSQDIGITPEVLEKFLLERGGHAICVDSEEEFLRSQITKFIKGN